MDNFFRKVGRSLDRSARNVRRSIDRGGRRAVRRLARFGDKLQIEAKKAEDSIVQASKDVGRFGREKGDEISGIGASVTAAGVASGQPEIAAVGGGLAAAGQGLKAYGDVGQSIRKLQRK